MKGKRLTACVLALLLLLPASVPQASAAGFTDVTGSWAWAAEYVNDMTQRGIFKGYEDGTFRPANQLTAAEALALCARSIGLDDGVTEAVADDRGAEVEAILGTSLSWFHEDFAVCLELGIITSAQLKSLWQTGNLQKAVTKEDFSVYLVRAMGLDRLAESLSSYSMTFTDLASITTAKRPYVYLLNVYGIVQGTTDNKFEPQLSVNRAVSATMLSRMVEFMADKHLEVELADYTDYDWDAGTIAAAVAGDAGAVQLTLNKASGSVTYTLPDDAPIYLDNMQVSSTSLKVGYYARVCLNDDDVVAVRLAPSERLETVSASITQITGDSITLVSGGVSAAYAIDRFTQITVGGKTGDSSLLDIDAGYTDAVCTVDGDDALMLQLSGGTSGQAGLIKAVTTGTTSAALQVTSFNGVTQTYTVPSAAVITINGLSGTLKASHAGYYVSMRISNDVSGQVVSAAVDTSTTYIQGKVLGVTYTSNPNTLYALNLSSGDSVVYTMADNPTITYEGSAVSLQNVTKGWYFTAKLDSSGKVKVLEAFQGESTVAGTLSSISYGSETVLTVTGDDGKTYAFTLNMTKLPTIKRSEKTSSIDKLRAGDGVTVTSQYNQVTLIEAEPQQANVTGTITRIIQEVSGNILQLALADGSTASYTVTNETSITKDGDAVSLSSLQPGYTLALVVSNDQVSAIEVTDTATETSSTQLTGTVLYVNTTDKTILVSRTDTTGTDYIVTVKTTSSTKFISIEGSTLTLSKLAIDDQVIAYGSFDNGQFNATLVIRN